MAVFLVLLLAASTFALPAEAACWKVFGTQDTFGSDAQATYLKQALRQKGCRFHGMRWRTRMPRGGSALFLVFDTKDGVMLRVHSDASGITWSKWTGVTPGALLAENPMDGSIDVGSYSSGSGRVAASAEMKAFLRSNGGVSLASCLR
ncbi:MAG: hypothetical protein ABIP29_12505 [Candidatus Eisenbacteria bacterium]